jgi:hypothetical protein
MSENLFECIFQVRLFSLKKGPYLKGYYYLQDRLEQVRRYIANNFLKMAYLTVYLYQLKSNQKTVQSSIL